MQTDYAGKEAQNKYARAWALLSFQETEDFYIGSGMFSDLSDNLKNEDRYMVCADFAHYCDTRDRLNREYSDETRFASKRIMNIAGAGYFSSDRSVGEYAKRIWGIKK